jgi:hypothetical protein
MTSIASPTYLPPLGAHDRKEVGLQLQATLLELVDLSLVGKQLHWSVVGPVPEPRDQRADLEHPRPSRGCRRHEQ